MPPPHSGPAIVAQPAPAQRTHAVGPVSSDLASSAAVPHPACSSAGTPKPIRTDIPFAERRLNLGATPATGTLVTTIDLDLTVACNMRCTYCFKEKWNEHMEDHVAFDALVWLLYASGPAEELTVNLIGGEPLLRFPLIQRIVPFGKRRAWQMGKTMHFGVTTNCTLVTEKVVDFWRKWGMGFHTSIDGTPDIQDRNRPLRSGQGSARLVEQAVPEILAYRPNTTARCTVVPESAASLTKTYRYFRSLGYTSIAFTPASPDRWTGESNAIFAAQLQEIGDLLIEEFRQGRSVDVTGISATLSILTEGQRPSYMCGAGRGSVLVDIHGDLWPCHRWNKAAESSWRIGSIYEQFNDLSRASLDRSHTDQLQADCAECDANRCCRGGCPAENLEVTGNPFRPHANTCEHVRATVRVARRVHEVLSGEKNPTFLKRFQPSANPVAGAPSG